MNWIMNMNTLIEEPPNKNRNSNLITRTIWTSFFWYLEWWMEWKMTQRWQAARTSVHASPLFIYSSSLVCNDDASSLVSRSMTIEIEKSPPDELLDWFDTTEKWMKNTPCQNGENCRYIVIQLIVNLNSWFTSDLRLWTEVFFYFPLHNNSNTRKTQT